METYPDKLIEKYANFQPNISLSQSFVKAKRS